MGTRFEGKSDKELRLLIWRREREILRLQYSGDCRRIRELTRNLNKNLEELRKELRSKRDEKI